MKNEPKSYSVKFYAEMKLDDGRMIATEDEQFMIGSKVFAIGDDGDAEALSAGNYKMENGNEMTIGENSEILDLGEEKEAEDVEASEESTEEELAEEADVADWEGMEKRIKNLEDAIADIKAKMGEGESSKEEEMAEETPSKNPKTITTKEVKEFSAEEELENLKAENEKLKTELSKKPAENPINTNKFSNSSNSITKSQLSKLSTRERFLYDVSNKN